MKTEHFQSHLITFSSQRVVKEIPHVTIIVFYFLLLMF